MVSLRVLIFSVVVTVSIIPIILFSIWPQSRALDNAVAEVSERHLLLASNLGSALTRYYKDLVTTFTFLAENELQHRNFENTQSLLQGLSFRHICILDSASGTVISELSPQKYPCPDIVPAKRRAVFDALAEEDRVVTTGVMQAPDGSPALFMLQRFGDNIVVGAVSTDYFVELSEAISFGKRGHAAIVDQNGRLLAHPLPQWRQERRDISALEPVRRMVAGQTGVSRFYSPAIEQDMIAGYTTVAGPGWGVMIPQPFAELEEEAASVREYTLIIILCGTALALVASWLLSTALTRPISRFVEATAKLRKGEAGTRVTLDQRLTSKELVDLGAAFNEMVETLEHAAKKEMKLRHEAEKADHFKSKFLANMSHEIRTPLNAILGFSQLIKQQHFGPDYDRYREYAEDIHQSGSMMLNLINDILDLSKVESGHETLEPSKFDLVDVVDRCIQMFRQQAMSRGVRLELQCGYRSLAVYADPLKTKQMLLNLLSNAVKFTPSDGSVVVEIRVEDRRHVVIAVTDTGIGIRPDDMKSVLMPFGQVEASDTAKEGTGLGLPLVKALAELHGGSFELDSIHGLGTKATIRLADVVMEGQPVPDENTDEMTHPS